MDCFEYVKKLKSNPIARKIKLANLTHNSDQTRLDNITNKDKKRIEKYLKAIEILSE